jgi:hypothetical protein
MIERFEELTEYRGIAPWWEIALAITLPLACVGAMVYGFTKLF